MTDLYNCKHGEQTDQYRITKFNEHAEPIGESSYLLSLTECTCPAGHRPMCRHREMLPLFLERGTVDSGWFYDYSRGGWVEMFAEPRSDQDEPKLESPLEVHETPFNKDGTAPEVYSGYDTSHKPEPCGFFKRKRI